MKYLVGLVVMLPFLILIFGMLTGRVKVNSCCAIADPSKDLRMNPYQDR